MTENNPLDRGDGSEGYRRCEICNNRTLETAIPLRAKPGDAASAGTAVQLIACETCQTSLAEVDWDEQLLSYDDQEDA